eukprot:TRINITY_DN6994_c0_g2_i5.p1 TRINITY_DN6994_c0_g2~~TRINITY_DN6994_c0_g2_i5.p1  ORF type:complete len:115 (+),score=26.35 TRINITY_DN6994_c0_g2_i5:536-880(+)
METFQLPRHLSQRFAVFTAVKGFAVVRFAASLGRLVGPAVGVRALDIFRIPPCHWKSSLSCMLEELFSLRLALPIVLGGFELGSSKIVLVLMICSQRTMFLNKIVDVFGFKNVL